MTRGRSFDPQSPGARRLAQGWLRNRERWLMRVLLVPLVDGSGRTVPVGSTLELPAPMARVLLEDGSAELVSTRLASVHDAG